MSIGDIWIFEMNLKIDQTVPLERLTIEVIADPKNQLLVADHGNRYQFCQPLVSGKIVLDGACGTGFGSYILAQANAQHVDAIDISSEAINMAQRYYAHPKIHFEVCDILSLAATSQYDIIVSFETIEHIADTEKYLQGMQQALKPGGSFFVSTPNRNVSNPRAARFDKPRNPFHCQEWTTAEFVELLAQYFVVEEVYGQHPHYYKGTRARTIESVFMSKRLRKLLHLPEANYWKRSQVRRIKACHEPVFLIVQCRKKP